MTLILATSAAVLAQAGRAVAQDPPTPESVREVAPLDVEVSATRSSLKQKMRGFEQRRLQGRGTFLTREQIEKRAAITVSDLLLHIQGVTVRADPIDRTVKVTMGRGIRECEPQYFLDGSPRLPNAINDYRTDQIEGMEVYSRFSMAPAGYRSGSCGSIMIWTLETLRPNEQ